MQEWDKILQQFADDPSEYQSEKGTILFNRHGRENSLTIKDRAGIGLAVQAGDFWVPLSTFIQRDLLELNLLANQICRALDKIQSRRPVSFVDGPAELSRESRAEEWAKASQELSSYLLETEPGSTRVIQLMAGAGRGKTVLLENTALEFARNYQPDPHPTPLLLPIDLLGRYVGTIDDAIAGSLNNTYLFPRLAQRDIIVALNRGWIILALDGFDELVARVGVRDAFYRINEILDQLAGTGTIILSARESFFELYQISASIRTYLQPRNGAYSTAVLKLSKWSSDQGKSVFAKVGSVYPDEDFRSLSEAFENDEEVVLHPFFLTRLADLWHKGERFEKAAGQPNRRARMQYVIETFVGRESKEKWIDREGNPLLSTQGHTEMLSAIAEEMWRTGAFSLDTEELKIAAEIGLTDSEIPTHVLPQILERLPTHAAFQPSARGFAFLHDRFLHYFLAVRVEKLLLSQNPGIKELLSARDLPPEIVDWVVWRFQSLQSFIRVFINYTNKMREEWGTGTAVDNLSAIAARVLDSSPSAPGTSLSKLTFISDVFAKSRYSTVMFQECSFLHIDLSDSKFIECSFDTCKFGDVRISNSSNFKGTRFRNCSFVSLELQNVITRYAPEDIAKHLELLGAEFPIDKPKSQETPQMVTDEFLTCLESLVRASERTCDVVIEEVDEEPRALRFITKTGLQIGIIKNVKRDASGPRKHFIRFAVDREKLLRGQAGSTGNNQIDNFWEEARKKFPR